MCGIIGVVGADDAVPTILAGLHALEYRGYDSAGVALVSDAGLWRARAADASQSVRELFALCDDAPVEARTGIGHTRWATHGNPNVANAHPHLDCTGQLALIHNGIIENYLELKVGLESSGHQFSSVTDSEVLVHLIEVELGQGDGLVEATRRAIAQVRGAFSVAVVSAAEPELIVAARRISPLIVGFGGGAGYLASDIPALIGRCTEVYAVEDDQLVALRPGSMEVTSFDGAAITPVPLEVDWDIEVAEKGGYEDFMTKEIHEQPQAVAATLLDRVHAGHLDLDELSISDADLAAVTKIFLVGCGSSFHTSMVGKFAIEAWAKLPAEVDIASEFMYRDAIFDERTLVIGVSQSGETIDTLQAIRRAKAQGAKILAVTNIVGSSMARDADGALYTRAGLEISVASTKTVLAQVTALQILALRLAELRGTMTPAETAEVFASLRELPAKLTELLDRTEQAEVVAKAVASTEHFFFLGRHVGLPVALEGALKLKEISYRRAEGYPAGELKHGPIALIEPGTVVVAVVLQGPLAEKMHSNIAEVKSRGATIVAVAEDDDEVVAGLCDYVLRIPTVPSLLAPVLAMVPLQLLAYHVARGRGLDVDRPRNLAKTVTVE